MFSLFRSLMHPANVVLIKKSSYLTSQRVGSPIIHCLWSNHYMDLHKITKRATPEMFCQYKTALLLYRLFNDNVPEDEWIQLNVNIINTSRQTRFMTNRNHSTKVGLNCIANRLHMLNDKIPLTWLNKSFNSFEIECKKTIFVLFKPLKIECDKYFLNVIYLFTMKYTSLNLKS